MMYCRSVVISGAVLTVVRFLIENCQKIVQNILELYKDFKTVGKADRAHPKRIMQILEILRDVYNINWASS